jgi:hypothetical protein
LRRAFPVKDYRVSIIEAGNSTLKPFWAKKQQALREANKNIVLFRTNNKQGQSNYTLLNGTTHINGSIKCMQSENNYDSQRKETVVSTLVRKRFSTFTERETEMKTRAFLAPEGSSDKQTSRKMLHWWTTLKVVPTIDTSIEVDSSKGPIRGVTKRKISLALQGKKNFVAFVRVSNDIASHTHEATGVVNKSTAAGTRSSKRKKKAQAFTKSNDNASHTQHFTLSLPFSHACFTSSNLEVL